MYHALNRGVDKRTIFLDNQDYARFVHNMFEFNTTKPANNLARNKMNDIVSRPLRNPGTGVLYTKLVDVHGWCLMGNHYHLLLSDRIEGGISLFLRKLNVGYAKYFNERYNRAGTLFQGRTKKILINTDAYFLHILNYIHLNPLDFEETSTEWRSRKIDNIENALATIRNYHWSSYQDYTGIKNFPSILTTSLFQSVFEGNYSKQLEQYLCAIEVEPSEYLILE